MVPDATVTAVNGRTIRVEFREPSEPPAEVTLAERVAAEIARVAYFSPAGSVTVGGIPGRVTHVAGPKAELELDAAPVGISPGSSPEIVAGSRLIAIRDFELLGQVNQDDARALLEEVTTYLARSGQFRLVERSKLDAVLAELKLSLSDLASPEQARKVGQLLTADTVVTGTLLRRGDTYVVNLRLVNSSGEIYNAVATAGRMTPISRTPGLATGNIEGGFEDKGLDETGWDFGRIEWRANGRGGHEQIDIDATQGAAGSGRSLRLQFVFGEPIPGAGDVRVWAHNRKLRDLSRYRGATFYLKANPPLAARFHVYVGPEFSSSEIWSSDLDVGTGWRQYRVQWVDLAPGSLSRPPRRVASAAPKRPPAESPGATPQLDLTHIAAVGFTVHANRNPGLRQGTAATLWVDEVSFF